MHSIIKASALIVLLIYCVIGQITEQSVLQAQWTDCAAYGQVCKCPSDTLCVIRFGGADVWIFKQVLAMSLPCTRDVFGDMIQSAGLKDKDASCYVSFPQNQSKSWHTVADDHHKFTLTNLTEIRYGSERHNVWTYGLLANDTFECNDALLGFYPPNPYTDKKCQIGPLFPQPVLEQPLADAGKSFDLLEADALFSVYHGSFIAQMASSSKIECNPNNFGLKGLSSAPCGLVSGYPVQFDNPVAEWFQAETCAKTATCIYTLQEGVTSTTTSATAEYWSLSLAATTSAGMTYKGANFGGQLTGTISAALTLTQTHAYTMTESKSCAASCTPSVNETVVLWQWIVNTIEMNFATSNLPEISDSFNTLVCSYMCLPEGYEPLCPPGYCADSTCQTCTEPLFTSS